MAALVTDTGEPVANLQTMVKQREKEQLHRLAELQKREKITSLTIALGVLGSICVLLALIVVTRPVPPPPMITASAVEVIDDTIDSKQIQKPQMQQRPDGSTPPMDLLSVAAASPIAMPSLETPSLGTGLDGIDAGMGFGNSMGLSLP